MTVNAERWRTKEQQKFSGDFVGRITPVAIPNTEVQGVGAVGTAWEFPTHQDRKSPDYLKKARESLKALGGFHFEKCDRERTERNPPPFRLGNSFLSDWIGFQLSNPAA